MSCIKKTLIFAFLFLVGIGVVTGSVYAAASPLDRLVEIHDFEVSLDRASADVKTFADDLREFGFPVEAAWMTGHILSRAYEPDKFLLSFKSALKGGYDTAYAAGAVRWLTSPLGQKFHKLDTTRWSQDTVDERRIYSELMASFPPPESRWALVERLDEAWNLTDLSMDRIVPIVRLWFPRRDKLLDESPRALVEKLRKKLREPLHDEILRGSLYAFQSLSDKELADVVSFAESNAGRWYGRVFQKSLVAALGDQVMSSATYLNRFLESVGADREGVQVLMEAFPPGERYVALRKRDPFKPLVSEDGIIMAMPRSPKKVLRASPGIGRNKDFPVIPLEIYKKLEKQDSDLFAKLEFYQGLFGDKAALKAMDDSKYLDTAERYRALIDRANRTRADFAKSPLLTKYEGLKFVGVIWSGKESLALVETEGKKGHVVRKGTLVGPNFGSVDSIDASQVIIVERFKDYLGEVLAKRKKIKFSGAS